MLKRLFAGLAYSTLLVMPLIAQEPVAWGTGPSINFHTFSIVAVDPKTGETGVIVTSEPHDD